MNKKGFSLLEVIIALGLMGAASVFMMKLRQNQVKSQKTTENSAFIHETFTEIRAYLQKPGVCHLSMDGNKIESNLSINSIKRMDGTDKYKVGEKLSGGSYKISKIWFDHVLSSQVDGPESEYRGEGKLNFEFEKTNLESFGAKKITKSLEIDFVEDKNGKLVECAALGSLVIPKSLLGTPVTETPSENAENPNMQVPAVLNNEVNQGNNVPSNSEPNSNEVFANAITNLQKSTGTTLTQDDINKAVKENPQLIEMMNLIKDMEDSNSKVQKILEEE